MPDTNIRQLEPGKFQISGRITKTLVLNKPGVYTALPGTQIVISPQDSRQMIGCQIKSSGVTLIGLQVQGAFRAFSFQGVNDLVFRNCQSLKAGFHPSPHGSGGHGFLGNDGRNCRLENCLVENPAGHGLYVGQTWDGLKIVGSKFHGNGGHSPVFQLNSEGGRHILGVRIEDTEITEATQNTGLVNLWGAGSESDHIVFVRCLLKGGAGGLNADAIENRMGGLPSFAELLDCNLPGPDVSIHAWNRSKVWKKGNTKVVGKVVATNGGWVG
jgi:hypothetical protein